MADKKTQEIQTLRWRLDPSWFREHSRVFEMRFPGEWYRALKPLLSAPRFGQKQESSERSLPINTLNSLLFLLFEGLVAVESRAGSAPENDHPGRPWLVSEVEIAPENVIRVVCAWIPTAFSKADSQSIRLAQERIRQVVPSWTSRSLPLTLEKQTPNGTAVLEGSTYHLVPHLLVRHASKVTELFRLKRYNEKTKELEGEEPLTLVPVRSPSGKMELMSWLPYRTRMGVRAWSMVWSWDLETVPGDPEPWVLLNLSVRRWVIKKSLPYGKNRIYLRRERPFFPGMSTSPTFVTAPLTHNSAGSSWGDDLAEVLKRLHLGHDFPKPEDLLTDRQGWIEGKSGLALAAVFQNVGPHPVKAGFSVLDHQEAFELVQRHFPMLRSADPNPAEARYMRGTASYTKLIARHDAISPAQLREAFSKSVGENGTLLLCFQTPALEEIVREELERRFDLGSLAGVEVRSLPLGVHSSLLSDREKEEQRARSVAEFVAGLGVKEPLGALIELDDWRDTESEDRDPKAALRAGFRQAGFITQFLAPPAPPAEDDEEDETERSTELVSRVRAAVRDLLRGVGYMTDYVLPPFRTGSAGLTVDAPLTVMGLATLLRDRKYYLPVLLRWTPASMAAEVTFPGHSSAQWLSYRKAGLEIGSLTKAADNRRWLLKRLAEITERTLLTVAANPTRRWWPYLADGTFGEKMSFHLPGEGLPTDTEAMIRVVRCRGGDEVPSYFVREPADQALMSGLFRDGSGRWFGVHPRNHNLTIPSSFHKLQSPNVLGWIPQAMELIPAGFGPGENPVEAVAFTHFLRRMNPHYDDATVMPVPIHLAMKLAENWVGF